MSKLTETEFLQEVNSIVLEQEGKPLNDIDCLLLNSEMDSFDYAFFWVYMDDKFPELGGEDFMKDVDYSTLTIRHIFQAYKADS